MNPYQVLGVHENATDDEIKNAYRKLVKKYHPDRFTHGSAEQAAASEHLKQVNAAYDMAVKMRQGNFNWSGTSQFTEIRSAIQRGAVSEAEAMLNRMTERPAEWHYLMGIVLLRRGWYDGAAEHFTRAYQMDPANGEYEKAMRAMTQSAGMYANFGDEGAGVGMSSPFCKICMCGVLGCLGSNLCFPWLCCF